MLVTCKICKTKVDRDSCYKRVVNGKNWYYCSETEYDKHEAEKQDKDKVFTLINDVFGYTVQNTILFKEYQEWLKLCNNKGIASYIEENKNYIVGVMGKDFSSEYAKIRYFSAILKNSLTDYKPKVKVEIDWQKPVETYKSNYKQKVVRVGFDDLEEEYE